MVPRELVNFVFPRVLMFPSTKHQDSRENKTNCFPRDHTLSILYCFAKDGKEMYQSDYICSSNLLFCGVVVAIQARELKIQSSFTSFSTALHHYSRPPIQQSPLGQRGHCKGYVQTL